MASQSSDIRILVAEDEPSILEGLKLNLELENYYVVSAVTGGEALEKIRQQKLDLIILDVMLPEIDGFGVCKTIRLEGNKTPVLFLTARSAPADRVQGLTLGDDYLSKPFHLEELLLRVEKLIEKKRDVSQTLDSLDVFEFGEGMQVDFKSFEILDREGQRQSLSKREIMLLKLLISKEGEVVSREEILESIWGYNVFPNTRTIDNYLLNFRKYFEENPKSPRHFHSVRGVGYRFKS